MDYSSNFQDNIHFSSFDCTSNNILNWINENRNIYDWAKDPNSYEMVNLFLFGSKYSHEGKSINIDTLSQIWNIRSSDFSLCNISKNNFVYQICQDSYESILSNKPLVNDENSHHALRKMAGLGLYLKQQQRDTGKVFYDNPQELLHFLECSNSLKTFHPNLFDRYGFKENINVLCNLQLENELPVQLVSEIKDSYNKIFNKSTPNKTIKPDLNSTIEKS